MKTRKPALGQKLGDREFEELLRRSSDYLKTNRPRLLKAVRTPRRFPASAA
jgi:hypothetical protein